MSGSRRKFALLLLVSALVPAAAAPSAPVAAVLDRVYFFLSGIQARDGGIGEGRTSEQCLVAAAFVRRGHTNRARRLLDVFDVIRAEREKSGNFGGFAAVYDEKRRPVESDVEPFAQAAAAAAMYNYKAAGGGRRYDKTLEALAAAYMPRLNAWGLLSASAHSSTAAVSSVKTASPSALENLCAYYVLSAAAAATGDENYLKAAKRMSFALKDLFYDESRRTFTGLKGYGSPAPDGYANILGALFGGPWNPAVSPDASGGVGRLALSELAVAARRDVADPSGPAPATAMFLSFPRDIPDGAFIASAGPAAQSGSPSPDYFATAVFAFISEGINPFAITDERYLRRFEGAAARRGEDWKSDGFDYGEQGFYAAPGDSLRNAEAFTGLDDQVKKSGRFSLRVQFVPLKNEKSSALVERTFYPPQDFAGRGRIRFWLAARPAVFTLGSMNLKIRLRATDENGLWADSQSLNYSGRGVENTVVCPAGFSAPPGGRHPDYGAIKKISWIFEENTQTSWNINLDDVRIE